MSATRAFGDFSTITYKFIKDVLHCVPIKSSSPKQTAVIVDIIIVHNTVNKDNKLAYKKHDNISYINIQNTSLKI